MICMNGQVVAGLLIYMAAYNKPRCFDCGSPYTFPAGIPDEPAGGWRLNHLHVVSAMAPFALV